ncbi:28S ribosomal protein S7, mitochondrial-like [Pollicipes pollicipes]|uniref:28S ribosomal protein S7, mitochondrial-like n=1 Tax=Pollicipes pollicipes TaxID=41117 RepID=UPI001884D620|nr:28S ribosomal protein S7, mitochondrial-like [Pollicipes pollicipes]XP_037074528.1 28S ribosomal protein S7, mitochondrial-like [Pollicipes pollicipes]XP_037074529.1 28S ribosomal protein S7, mitochondrial-like [Pollicipes pollicipes]
MFKSLCGIWRLQSPAIRAMSQYPPIFKEPLLPPQQDDEVREQFAFSPIKAAPSNVTSSAFDHPAVRKFTNIIMRGGGKDLAQTLVAKTFERIKRTQIQRYNEASAGQTDVAPEEVLCDPLQVFLRALENSRPRLQLVPIIRGGITYKVPRPVTEKRATFVAMRWFKEAGREKDRTVRFSDRLAAELISAANNEGRVVRLKQELHRQCEANRAYAHYTYG